MAKCRKCKTETVAVVVDVEAHIGKWPSVKRFGCDAKYCPKCDRLTYIKQWK